MVYYVIQESDRLKLSHSQMLRDVRENYTLELEKAKAHLDETLRSVKGTEAGEVYRVKEDMLERYLSYYTIPIVSYCVL